MKFESNTIPIIVLTIIAIVQIVLFMIGGDSINMLAGFLCLILSILLFLGNILLFLENKMTREYKIIKDKIDKIYNKLL